MGEEKKGMFGRAAGKVQAVREERAESKAETARLAEERRHELIAAGELYEYSTAVVRETLVGDKINTDVLQRTINAHANEGWRLKTATSASVAGRAGPGGTSGLILIFERRVRG